MVVVAVVVVPAVVAVAAVVVLLRTPQQSLLLLLRAVLVPQPLLPVLAAVAVVREDPRISGLRRGTAPVPSMRRSPRRVSISCEPGWTTSIPQTAAGETSAAGPTLLSG